MYAKVLQYSKEHRMLLPGERVIVGLSGGADSVCLLDLLNRMKKELFLELKAVHVHHGLRGDEADRDAKYAEELSGRLGVPFVCVYEDVAAYGTAHKMSVEEAGRYLRYEVLERERLSWNGGKIAVAHHGDDQAETILYHLFRGTGLKGLGGIRPVRDCIVRPLLCVDKEEIMSYLQERGLACCEDSTNASSDYARNRLRNQVLPLIKSKVNQGAVAGILRAGDMAAQADVYLEEVAFGILKSSGIRREGRRDFGVPVKVLSDQPEIIRTYVMKQMISTVAGSLKDVSFSHIGEAAALLNKGVGRRVDLPYGLIAVRDYEILWIKEKKTEHFVEEKESNGLPAPVYTVFPFKKGQEIPENGYTKWFDYDKMGDMPSARYRKTGDYITLADGGRKSVKAYMIDEKIPREERDRIPLIAEGDHVLWIVGYRISQYYKITEYTRTILQIQIMEEG